jgi:hypothetical protein
VFAPKTRRAEKLVRTRPNRHTLGAALVLELPRSYVKSLDRLGTNT